MKKLAVYNQKGGIGKSTISAHLAHGFAILKYKVCLIDFDPQNDAAFFLGVSGRKGYKTILDFYKGEDLSYCAIPAREYLDVIVNRSIKELESELYRVSDVRNIFNERFKDLEDNYDILLIDCHPTDSRLNDAVLSYIDSLILPVQAQAAGIRAVANTIRYLKSLGRGISVIKYVIPNMYDGRTLESKKNLEIIENFFEKRNIQISKPIPTRIKIEEAGHNGSTVFEYDKDTARILFKVIEKLVKEVDF